VWRLYDRRGMATADLVGLAAEEPSGGVQLVLHHPTERETSRALRQDELSDIEPLLEEVLREGTRVIDLPSIEGIRQRRQADVARLDPGVRRLVNPHLYHVSLTRRLWEEKQVLIASLKGARGGNHGGLE
jgi:nicotinate phosphoribosyltransferase